MYWKLSIRNARRSFKNYLLYVVTMTVLLAVMELSNCIAVAGRFADFQTVSLPLLITVVQIILVGYIDTFMFTQRAKEFASYLLLGMPKKTLTNLFSIEILLIGIFCLLVGTTVGYGFFCTCVSTPETFSYGFLYCKSMSHTFCCFCIIEIICGFRVKNRMGRLQIHELMQAKSSRQEMNPSKRSKRWGIIFLCSFVGLIGCVGGIVLLSEIYASCIISIIIIPLTISVIAFYQWIFRWLSAYRQRLSASVYRKNRLYLTAAATHHSKTEAIINAVFCMCFLFSAFSFMTGRFMLQPNLRFFEQSVQQWLGTAQIGICIVFTVIYFSMLALQQIMAFRQDAKHYQILHWIGKSSRQIQTLMVQQTAIRLTLPMIPALLILFICVPLLNQKLNGLLPPAMHNALLRNTGVFLVCTLLFYAAYFFVVFFMSKADASGEDTR